MLDRGLSFDSSASILLVQSCEILAVIIYGLLLSALAGLLILSLPFLQLIFIVLAPCLMNFIESPYSGRQENGVHKSINVLAASIQ